MTPDFTPTPEAVEAVAKAIDDVKRGRQETFSLPPHPVFARAAIAAFVEAEGIKVERAVPDPDSATQFEAKYRLFTHWRPLEEASRFRLMLRND